MPKKTEGLRTENLRDCANVSCWSAEVGSRRGNFILPLDRDWVNPPDQNSKQSRDDDGIGIAGRKFARTDMGESLS